METLKHTDRNRLARFGLLLLTLAALHGSETLRSADEAEKERLAALAALQQRLEVSLGEVREFLGETQLNVADAALELETEVARVVTEVVSQMEEHIRFGEEMDERARTAALLALQQRLGASIGEAGRFLNEAPLVVADSVFKLETEAARIVTEAVTQLEDLVNSRYFGPIKLEKGKRLDFAKTAEIYEYAVRQWYKLPKYTGRPTKEQMERAERDMYAWTMANGFGVEGSEFMPVKWDWLPWELHIGIYALTDCKAEIITMNNAYDPTLPEIQYPRPSEFSWPAAKSTLQHEGVHKYGKICRRYLKKADDFFQSEPAVIDNGIERTAQVKALEVLASMANNGDIDALYAFSHLRREIAWRAMIYMGIEEGKGDQVIRLMKKLGEDPFAIAQTEKLFEAAKRSYMSQVVIGIDSTVYGFSPLVVLMDASFDPEFETKKLLKFDTADQTLHFYPSSLRDTFFLLDHEDTFIAYVVANAKEK